DILNSPLRLNRRNIKEHFACLDNYLNEIYIHEEVAVHLTELKNNIGKLRRKLNNVCLRLEERKLIKRILLSLAGLTDDDTLNTYASYAEIDRCFEEAPIEQLMKHLNGLYQRYNRKAKLAVVPRSSELLRRLSSALTVREIEQGVCISLSNERGIYNPLHCCPINEEQKRPERPLC
ncbi:MAG: hypothetical protein ACREQV_04755, partial [Candidatus Binatia bacterium]